MYYTKTLFYFSGKNVPSLVVSPHNQTVIMGTANIARYILRLLKPDYDFVDPVFSTNVDEWLDLAQMQIVRGNNKERGTAVKTLNSRLGRSAWLVGSGTSLADIVVSCLLHQTGMAADLPANVKKWLKSCDSLSISDKALKIMASCS